MQFPNSTRRDPPHAQWADIESGEKESAFSLTSKGLAQEKKKNKLHI